MPPSRRFWSGNSPASHASASTPSPSSPCSGARESASSPSPSTPTTPPPASSWRPSSSRWTNSTAKILPRRSRGGCARRRLAASGSPAGCPTASARSTSRTGPRSAPPWNPTRMRPVSLRAPLTWPRPVGGCWTSPAPSTTRASPAPQESSGPRTASISSSETKPTQALWSGARTPRTRPTRCASRRRSPASSPRPNSAA